MALMVTGVAALCVCFDHVLLTKLRPDALPALAFFANWHYILEGASYFDQIGAPSPLTHLWYVGVDAQVCILLPLVLWLCAGKAHLGRVPLAGILLVLAAASALLMGMLYDPALDPSRVYYGTDTRAFSVFIGAALACAWPLGDPPAWARSASLGRVRGARFAQTQTARLNPLVSNVATALGAASLLAIAAIQVLVPSGSQFFYYGGMVLVSLLAGLLIVSLTVPGGLLARAFNLAPVVWLGERSYGLYLWHYPLIVLLGAYGSTAPWWLMLVAVALSVLVAQLSWRFFETPIATGRTAAAWRFLCGREDAQDAEPAPTPEPASHPANNPRTPLDACPRAAHFAAPAASPQVVSGSPIKPLVPSGRRPHGPSALELAQQARSARAPKKAPRTPRKKRLTLLNTIVPTTGLAALLLFAVAGSIVVPHTTLVPEEAIRSTGAAASQAMDLASMQPAVTAQAAVPGTATDARGYAVLVEEAQPLPVSAIPEGDMVVYAAPQVNAAGLYEPFLIGDSVPGGMAFYEVFPTGFIDSYIGRRPDAAISVLREYVDMGVVGRTVVVASFSNTTAWPEQLDELVSIVGPNRELYLVATVNPQGFQDTANWYLIDCASRYENVFYVDWPAYVAGNEWWALWGDNIHLTPDGGWLYAQMVARHVAPSMVSAGGQAVAV